MIMAGVRSVPRYDDWPEIVCLGLVMLVFAVWAIGLYVYAWVRVFQRLRELRTSPCLTTWRMGGLLSN
jgi:hypothetical protein